MWWLIFEEYLWGNAMGPSNMRQGIGWWEGNIMRLRKRKFDIEQIYHIFVSFHNISIGVSQFYLFVRERTTKNVWC